MQTRNPLPDLFCLALVLSGRLANLTLNNMNVQLLLKWEALATLSPYFPVEAVHWTRNPYRPDIHS